MVTLAVCMTSKNAQDKKILSGAAALKRSEKSSSLAGDAPGSAAGRAPEHSAQASRVHSSAAMSAGMELWKVSRRSSVMIG